MTGLSLNVSVDGSGGIPSKNFYLYQPVALIRKILSEVKASTELN